MTKMKNYPKKETLDTWYKLLRKKYVSNNIEMNKLRFYENYLNKWNQPFPGTEKINLFEKIYQAKVLDRTLNRLFNEYHLMKEFVL